MPEDKKIHLPFDDDFSSPEPEDGRPTQKFWDGVAKTLDQIEKNTRGAKNSASGKSNVKSSQSSSPGEGDSFPPAPPKTPRQDVSRQAPVAVPAKSQKSPNPSRQTASQAERKQAQPIAVQTVVQAQPARDSASAEKKRYAAEVKRLEAISKQQTNSLLKQLKTSFSKWDGSIGGAKLNLSSIGDLAGMAIGGPFWTAFKELKELVIKDGASSEKTLGDLLKKTFLRRQEEKATGPVRNSKGQFIGRNSQELKLAEESHELAKEQVAANKKRHDELVKAIKANHPKNGLSGQNGLLDTLRGRRGGGKGRGTGARNVSIPDANLPHGSRPTAHPAPEAPHKPGGNPVKGKPAGRKLGLFAGLAAMFGGGGDGQSAIDTASTAVDAVQTVNSGAKSVAAEKATAGTLRTAESGTKAAATVGEAGAGKAAGLGGKTLALGSKGALSAAKAIPVAGQLLAAGMAVYDGVNGWNDTEMHKDAFGLEGGQEASTGQKASAAAATVLDMGGLLTGAAGLLGFDVNTADIARGIYSVGDKVGEVVAHPIDSISKAATGLFDGVMSFFGGGEKPKEEAEAAKQGSSTSPAKTDKAETPKKENAEGLSTTAAVAAATGGVAGLGLLAAKKFPTIEQPQIEKPVAEAGSAATRTPLKAPSKVGKYLAVGAAGTLGVTGAAPGAKTYLDKANEDAGSETVSALNISKIPSLLETLANELSDLNEKLDQQIRQAANNDENSGIFNIFGGGAGGGYSGSGSGGGGGGGGYSGGGGGGSYAASVAYSGLGDIVMQGETGGKGTAMISSGVGDHGGVSYGRSQLASKINGSIGDALKWAKANGFEDIYNQLAPLQGDATNRNGQFAQKWAQLASEKGGRLEQFDRAYQKKGYYDPMMAKIRRANPELAKRIDANPALQEQVLSTAVQYGKNSSRFLTAANEVLGKNAGATDRDLVAGIQDIKARDVGSNFKSSSANVQNGVRNRHGNTEKKRLLALQDKFEKGEVKIDPATGTAQAVASPATQSNAGQLLQYDGASQGVRLNADGKTVNLSTVKGIDSLRLQQGVNIDKMHPEAVSRMASAAADYEELTGQKLVISEGYRDFAEQVRTKRRHGNNAATPGRSTHGMGNTFDIAKSKIVDVENRLKAAGVDPVKFFEDHGLKRTAYRPGASRQNDESWHFEAADLRTAEMQRDRDNLQSGKKTGAEYLTAEQKARYMAPVDQAPTAIADAQLQQQAQPAPQPVQIAQNEALSQAGKIARQTTGQSLQAMQPQPSATAEAKPAAPAPAARAENSSITADTPGASVAPPQPQAAATSAGGNISQGDSPLSIAGNMLAMAKNFMPTGQNGQGAGILSGIEPMMGKAREAISAASSPKTLLDKYLPREAADLVANVQNVAGNIAPLAGSIGKLLPDSAGSFIGNTQKLIGKIANPTFPNPSQLFAQPTQMASNFMQAIPQIPTRLPTPQPIMPTQAMQQGSDLDLGPLVKIMSELLDITRQNAKGKEKDTEGQNTSNIPMDFEDAYCFQFAHDMA